MAAVPIEMHFGDQYISTGTAFFWEHGEQLYLVTAWHCLSGRHYKTKKHLSPTAAEPDNIKVWWNIDAQPVGQKGTTIVPIRDEENQPLWLVDAEQGSDVDIAILPVTRPPNAQAYPINKLSTDHLPLSVGRDVFILGYPLGVEGVGLPIWKRGSLASEWQIPREVQPYWLVDTASRPGMSGSPVIMRSYDDDKVGAKFMDYGNNGRSHFLGLYSGRLNNDGEKDIQLGMVWSSLYIEPIINSQKRDD